MRKYLPVGILCGLVILLQLFTLITGTAYYLTQLTMAAYYALVAVGLCMLMGYAGQISLGQAGFFAIGGYTAASITTINLTESADEPVVAFMARIGLLQEGTNIYGDELLYVHPWLTCVLAVVITALIAFLIGIPVLKLKGHYLAMATLGFGIIVYRVVLGTPFFGEADGISSVPAFTILPGLSVNGDFSARISNYYIAWGALVAGVIILINIIHSRPGRALRSLHGSENAAQAVGINTARYKLNVFVLSAVYAALAGVLLTHYNGGIGPSEAGSLKSVRYVAIVAVGGMANLWGTLIAGVLLNFLSLRGVFGHFDHAVFGIILITVMLFAPGGILKIEFLQPLRKRIKTGAANAITRIRGRHDGS
jgi:branched-chain amino acid transport system permease protein